MLVTSVESEPTTLPMVTVICGAVTWAFQRVGKVVLPFNVRLLMPLKTVSPAKVKSLVTEKAPVETSVVFAAIVTAPVPSGPLVRGSPRFGPKLLAPIINPPLVTLMPPAKVLAEFESWSIPAPVLAIPPF